MKRTFYHTAVALFKQVIRPVTIYSAHNLLHILTDDNAS